MKLKHHESKLLRKVDFLQWKSDNTLREAQVLRNVNATCVQNALAAAVVHHNPECFNACPQPSCWSRCLLESTVGNVTYRRGEAVGMTRGQLLEPFERAFASTDAAISTTKRLYPTHHASL